MTSGVTWTRQAARVALVLFTCAGLWWLSQVDYANQISTNVAELLPADETDPDVELVRSLVQEQHIRGHWFVLESAASPPAEEAVATFVDTLAQDPALAEVTRVDGGAGPHPLGAYLFEQRLTLLLPEWLERQHRAFRETATPGEPWPTWLAQQTVRHLDEFLARPESVAFADLVPADPLLLLPHLADDAAAAGVAPASDEGPALVWARSRSSPLSNEGQAPVFTAIQGATEAAQAFDPTLTVRWTGVSKFAAASRQRIRAEISWLNTVSIVAVLVVTALLIRRPWRVIHLLPVVVLALLGAWVATTLLFDRIHIFVFVLGALLTGAAIDYGFHVSLAHAAGPAEGFGRFRSVLKPLIGSCATTVIGFSLLWWSPLPLLQQLGVFVTAGLLTAVAVALAYFGQLRGPTIEPRPLPAVRRTRVIYLLGSVLGLSALAGLHRLRWHDDIRELEVPAPALLANDQAVRAAFGEGTARSAYLVRGRDLAEVRTRFGALAGWHQEQTGKPLGGVPALLPGPDAYAAVPARLAALAPFPPALRAALEAGGYTVEEFEPFFAAWERLSVQPWQPYEVAAGQLLAQLRGPLSQTVGAQQGRVWLVGWGGEPLPTGTSIPREFGAVPLNQLQTLNHVFTRYRTQTLQLTLAGLVLVVATVFTLYGPRRGGAILLIPAAACGVAVGVLAWLGHPLNLFHLLGVFLGVCLSLDYAIFATEPRTGTGAPPASIRLAALTTLASFGVLVFSRIPVISALGASVALTVLVALALVELLPPPAPRQRTT